MSGTAGDAKLTCALNLFHTAKETRVRNVAQKNTSKNSTYVVVEAPVCISEPVEVSERVVRREVLELYEKLGEDFLHCLHELVHEWVHLRTCFRQIFGYDHEAATPTSSV